MLVDEGTPLRVLIVEDSEDDAFLLLREMRKGGLAPTAERVQSLAALDEALGSGEWDLVISDYRLPGFNALDVLKHIRGGGHELPVMVVSGVIGEEAAVEAMHAGACDYIMKDRLARLNPALKRELKEVEVRRQRRAAERALRESEEHFRQLAGNMEGVFWLVDLKRPQMLYVSAAYEQIWEQSPEPLFYDLDAFLDTVHPEDYGRVQEALAERGWPGFDEEYRIQRRDGSVRWVHTRSFPIHDESGLAYRCASLSSDITERKRLEFETKKMSRALAQTADAVMITDAHGTIEYVNPAFEEVTGYSSEEVCGERPSILNSGMHQPEFFAQLWRSLSNGVPFREVFINRRKNGDLYYESKTITPVRDEHGDITHFVSTGKDITESLRRIQEERRVQLYDETTGVANRVLLTDRLQRALLQARRGDHLVAVVTIGFDLSGLFGQESDNAVRERLLRIIVERLQEAVRESDAVARLGRDEFAVVQSHLPGRESCEEAARRVLTAFKAPLRSDGYELYVAPRIGIALYPDDAQNAEELMQRAEVAMEHAGGAHSQARYCFYDGAMGAVGAAKRSGGHPLSS